MVLILDCCLLAQGAQWVQKSAATAHMPKKCLCQQRHPIRAITKKSEVDERKPK